METMNIALPEPMKQFVQQQVERGGYSSVSEYIRDLIRTEQKAIARDTLEAEILRGLESGTATPMSQEDWAEIRADVVNRYRNRMQK